MEFLVLGPLEVRDDGRVLPLGGTRKRALLALLLLNANRPVAIERLIDALWGERPPRTAATTVHVYVSQLRKELGRERLTTNRAGYVLEVGADEFDRSRFERLVAAARLALDPAERAALLRGALALWRGPALGDLRYEPAAEQEADRLDAERLTALEERVDAELELGLHERLIGELEQLIAQQPLRERLHEQLMLALYRSGRQADALAIYRDTQRRFRDELGIEPGPGLRRLEQSILNHDPALGGAAASALPPHAEWQAPEPREERKVVTVLFADIAGFTRRAEVLDPEDVRRLLRRFHEPIRAELERFGATIEKFIGDAVMAVFGAPTSHEDDAERAVRAAVAIRDAVGRLRAGDHELDLDLRIGVNTGEVLAVINADVVSGEGMVAGDVVNTAARLQSAAPANGILVGDATHRATAEAILYRSVEPVSAKGKSQPVPAWEAIDVLTPLGTQAGRAGRAPFVGRARERDALRDALTRVWRDSRVELVTLVGEPGIGKSRLVSELSVGSDVETWLVGRCLPYGGLPYVALSQIVKAYAGIADSDTAAAAAAKVAAVVPKELPEAEWIGGHLRLLVGLESDARGERREMFAAWRRFFESLSARAGVVLVFEDIHWADDGLLDFLDNLAAWGRGRLLVVCTARRELLDRRPEWRGMVSMPPLTDDETEFLLAALIGERSLPHGLLVRIGGNPLFAEEFARSLGDADEVVVPESVQATIAARIDLLPTAEKAMLHAASVLGTAFDARAVAALEGTDVDPVAVALESLGQRALVRHEHASEYTFEHVLIRDVAYAQIPRVRRADHHRAAAEWLESAAERRDERIDALAHHYTSALELAEVSGIDVADLPERALRYLGRAGERSLQLHAYRQALDYFERARALGGSWEIHEGLGRALRVIGRPAEARSEFERALEEAPEPIATARLNRLIAVSFTSEYHYDDADAAFDRAEQALELLADTQERRRAWIDVQIARLTLLYWQQDAERMDALIERARPLVEHGGEPGQKAEFLASEFLMRLVRERYHASDKTFDVTRRFVAAREELGDRVDIARAHFNLGFVHLTRGDLDDAQRELEQSLATAEQTEDATLRSRSLTYLALVHRRRRDVATAKSVSEQALAVATELHMPEYVGAATATLGWIAWMEGRLDSARSHANAALEAFAASAIAAYPWEWTARLPLLAIALDEGRVGVAQDHARALLDPRQQPLPEELDLALRAADERSLRAAVELAVAAGLL